MKLKKKKAFTLTELLVVVVVIGVLSAVTLPKFNKVMETRKTTEAEELMSAVRMEQEKRCSLDKPYLADINELKDILPTQTTKNFEYSLTGTGIKAASKGKYSYELEIPSYSDGRICCNNKSECDKLNKDYPLCDDLIAMADYQEASSDCSAGPVCDNSHYNGEISTKECDCGKVTSTWRCSAETGYEWELPPYPACEPKPADNTQSCPSGYTGKKTQTYSCVDGVWTAGSWKNNCTKKPSNGGNGGGGYNGNPVHMYLHAISGAVYSPYDSGICGWGCGLKSHKGTQITATCTNYEDARSVCSSGGRGCYFPGQYMPADSKCSGSSATIKCYSPTTTFCYGKSGAQDMNWYVSASKGILNGAQCSSATPVPTATENYPANATILRAGNHEYIMINGNYCPLSDKDNNSNTCTKVGYAKVKGFMCDSGSEYNAESLCTGSSGGGSYGCGGCGASGLEHCGLNSMGSGGSMMGDSGNDWCCGGSCDPSCGGW